MIALLGAAFALAVGTVGFAPLSAAGPCDSNLPGSFQCNWQPPVRPQPPGGPGDSGGGGGGGGGGDTGGPPPKPPCWEADGSARWGWNTVPCTTQQYGDWSNEWQCYVLPAEPQPPKGAPEWEGHRDGAVYYCTTFHGPYINVSYTRRKWIHSQPRWSKEPPPIAEMGPGVVDRERPDRPAIGISPGYMRDADNPETNLVGVVGAPVWMWMADRSTQRQYGTYHMRRPAWPGGPILNATFTAKGVHWYMDNDFKPDVRCAGRGTPYDTKYGLAESPTCGYRYTEPGMYRVRAFVQWHVTWDAGWGQAGEYDGERAASVLVQIGEAQAPIVPES